MSNLGLIERARQMLNAAGRRDAQQHSANQQNTTTAKARSANQIATGNLKPLWMETGASVTSCQRQLHKLNRSHHGGADDAIKFTVSFTYYAHARTYYESFTSAEPKAPGELLCLLQRFQSAAEYKFSTRFGQERWPVRHRRRRLHDPFDSCPYLGAWMKLNGEIPCTALAEKRVGLLSQSRRRSKT